MDSMSEVFSSRLLWVPIALVFLYFLFKADAKEQTAPADNPGRSSDCDALRPADVPRHEALLRTSSSVAYAGRGEFAPLRQRISRRSVRLLLQSCVQLVRRGNLHNADDATNEDRLFVLRTLALRGILAHLSRRTLLRRCIRRYSHRHSHRLPRLLYAPEELPSDMALKTCCPETLRRHGASDLQWQSSPSPRLSPLGFLPYSQAPLH